MSLLFPRRCDEVEWHAAAALLSRSTRELAPNAKRARPTLVDDLEQCRADALVSLMFNVQVAIHGHLDGSLTRPRRARHVQCGMAVYVQCGMAVYATLARPH